MDTSVGASGAVLLILALMAAAGVRAEYYCGRANACYMVPSGCAYGDCDLEVVWSQQANSTKYDFKIAARHDGWVAVGLSADKEMGDDDVYMCIASGNGARFEHRFNRGTTIVAGTGDGVVGNATFNRDGVISCRVERDMSVTNNGVTFDLENDLYMFFGTGPLLGDAPVRHGEDPKITMDKIDFDELVVLEEADFDEHEHDTYDNGATTPAGILLVMVASAIVGLVLGRQ